MRQHWKLPRCTTFPPGAPEPEFIIAPAFRSRYASGYPIHSRPPETISDAAE